MRLPGFYVWIIVFFIYPLQASASAWPLPKNGTFLSLTQWWIVSDQHFDRNGNIQPDIAEYGFYSTSFYVERALGTRLTSSINFPFLNFIYTELPVSMVRQSAWKAGDLDLGLKYALTYEKVVAVNATLILGIPLAKHEPGALQSGDHEFNQLIRVDVSDRFMLFRSKAWANLYAGYNHRSLDYSDEIHYGLETGIDIRDKISFSLRLAGIDAIGSDENANYINPQSLFSNFKEYVRLSPEITYHITQSWGVAIGAGTTLSGKNTLSGTAFSIGVIHKKLSKA